MNKLNTIQKASIQALANGFREDVGLSEFEPFPEAVKMIRDAGYEYSETSFIDNTCSGFTQAVNGNARFEIGYNLDHNFGDPYKRFTLCHELGHVNIPRHTQILTSSPHYSKPEFQTDDLIELEADYFSICLLAPKVAFQNKIANMEFKLVDLQIIANHFGISMYAAALRFIELTDLNCSLIVSDTTGKIKYESRSKAMSEFLPSRFLFRQNLNNQTLTYRSIMKNIQMPETTIGLANWYPGISSSVETTESVLFLKYNNTVLTFLNPLTDDFEEEIDREDDKFFRRS